MFANHLKIILAQFRKYKLQALINIGGMAIGLAGCMLIAVYVLFEVSYDRHYENAGRIYRVSGEFARGSRATVSTLVAPRLAEDHPQIEAVARMYGNTPGLISRNDVSAYERGLRFVDSSLFSIFDFDWLQGDPRSALTQPNTVVLTESMARKYFADEDPMGKTLDLESRFPMTVVGVIRDLPENTHLQFDLLASVDLGVTRSGRTVENVLENWAFDIFHTYVLLEQGADIASLERDFPGFIKRHVPATSPNFIGLKATDVRDIHLFSTVTGEFKPIGNVGSLVLLSAVAFSVLVIACINFMNLSTARAAQRAREIGMRKVMGAERSRLVMQFLGESVFTTVLAFVVAFALVELGFPVFAALAGKNITLSALDATGLVPALLVFIVGAGLLAGSYPAFYLSSLQAGSVLKGGVTRGKAGVLFRNLLVVAQFSLSITLIVATVVVLLQTRFASTADLGFQPNRTVVVQGSLERNIGTQTRELRERLRAHPGIDAVAGSGNNIPLREMDFSSKALAEGTSEPRDLFYFQVSPGFVETYGIQMLAGRAFEDDRVADVYVNPTAENPQGSAGVVLNLRAAQDFGWTAEEALGREVRILRPDVNAEAYVSARVIGVMQNAWLESVRDPIKPLYFLMPPETPGVASHVEMSVRLNGTDDAGALAHIENVWQQLNPDIEMRTRFLEQTFSALYAGETRQGTLLRYFAGLALSLACVGLLGLAAFNAERRTREIGIRKVMGGSVWGIVLMLTNDFSKLVLVSNLIAWPLAYFVMNCWLENFAYRIDLTPLIFIGSGAIALCIAWVTVGGTAAKAASAKPALALRHE